MKILLHIGSPKTGTTALQQTLNASREYLHRKGVLYPRCAYNPYKQEIVSTGVAGRWRSARNYVPDGAALDAVRKGWLNRLRAEIDEVRPKAVILSSESLFQVADPPKMDELRAELAALGSGRIEVIAYVRQPSAHYLSGLQQFIKASHRVLPIRPPRFRQVLPTYAQVFGDEAIHVRGFDRRLLIKQDIVTDFVETYLAEFGVLRADLSEPEKTNESLSAEAMVLLRQYRQDFHAGRDQQFTYGTEDLIRKLQGLDRALGLSRPVLRPGIARIIDDLSRTDLIWLRDEYGIEFPNFDYAGSAAEAGPALPGFPDDLALSDVVTHDPNQLTRLVEALQTTPWAQSATLPGWLDPWLSRQGARRRRRRDWLRGLGSGTPEARARHL